MNRYFGTHTLGGEWHALVPRYLLLSERVRGKRILDIGCGTGIGSSLLLEMGAESVQGVDHRPEVVDLARIKHDKVGLDFHVMFWENLEFEDDSFDAVVCLDPSSPVTDHNLLLEVRRVLKDDGEYICALERSKVAGMESLLPRYGYDSPSNQISLNQATERVPQIGELSAHFETLFNIVQRPHLSYLFEPNAATATGATDASTQAHRNVPEGYRAGVLRSDAEAPPTDKPGSRWIPTDDQLLLDQDTVGGVELFFCGDADLSPPPVREIRLPYYNIMERLSQVIENLQARQSLGGETSVFDEVLDAPDMGPELRTTQEYIGAPKGYEHSLDDAPTGVRQRPTSPDPIQNRPDPASVFQKAELESYRDKISAHYRQIRQEIDTLHHHTRAALIERDDYINHLVQTIHAREAGAQRGAEPLPHIERGSGWQEETTRVFKIATLGGSSEASTLDELAELDDQSAAEDVARQIASLHDERLRIDALLEAGEQRLAELSGARDATPTEQGADAASDTPEDTPADTSPDEDSETSAPSTTKSTAAKSNAAKPNAAPSDEQADAKGSGAPESPEPSEAPQAGQAEADDA